MPAKFHFALDRVLEWYRNRCQMEENRLGEQNRALAQTREKIARLQAERLAVDSEMLRRESAGAMEFRALGLYRNRTRSQEAGLELEREARQKAVDEQRNRVRAVQRKIRLLEELRARRFAEHAAAEERELQALAADSYLAKWLRESHAKARPKVGMETRPAPARTVFHGSQAEQERTYL